MSMEKNVLVKKYLQMSYTQFVMMNPGRKDS